MHAAFWEKSVLVLPQELPLVKCLLCARECAGFWETAYHLSVYCACVVGQASSRPWVCSLRAACEMTGPTGRAQVPY